MKTKGKIFVFVLLVILLAIVMFLSLSIGAKSFSFSALLEAFMTQNESFEFSVIQQRLPRTIFGVLAGASLAVSGCLMQNITRNPIADPGILGVNSGAALFVVCGISFFHISGPFPYIVLGFLGALLTSFLVYGIASSGMGATPLKLVLAGAAVSIALQSIISMITMPNTQVMDTFRFWQTGSISGADWSSVRSLLFCFGIGMVLSFALAHSLNMISLGDELATGLGVRVQKTRAIACFGWGSPLCFCYGFGRSYCVCWFNDSSCDAPIMRQQSICAPSFFGSRRWYFVVGIGYPRASASCAITVRSRNCDRIVGSSGIYRNC